MKKIYRKPQVKIRKPSVRTFMQSVSQPTQSGEGGAGNEPDVKGMNDFDLYD